MQMSIVVSLTALIALGAGGLYTYSVTGSTALNSAPTSNLTAAQTAANSKADPGGKFLGFIPAGYTVASLLPNAATYPCPPGSTAAQCAQFKASCGNGVCDPNETCGTCPIDCGTPQGLSCDPYTGRASGLGGICEITIPYTNVNPSETNINTPPPTPGQATQGP